MEICGRTQFSGLFLGVCTLKVAQLEVCSQVLGECTDTNQAAGPSWPADLTLVEHVTQQILMFRTTPSFLP